MALKSVTLFCCRSSEQMTLDHHTHRDNASLRHGPPTQQELDYFAAAAVGGYAAVGDRVAVNMMIGRWATEDLFREQVQELRPYVDPTAGHVISTDFNAMVRLRGKMEVEPLPHGWLVAGGLVNPEPVRKDLAAGAFATVILGDNVFEPKISSNLELGGLPPVEVEEIRKHYRLIKHVKGPYMDGLYVYQPMGL